MATSDTTSVVDRQDSIAEAQGPIENALRKTLSDTYSAVRSGEVNKTVVSFTFDHYIDEAKRRIKNTRILQSASNQSQGVGQRPSQLDALTKLAQDFNNALNSIMDLAQKKDAQSKQGAGP